MAADSASVGPRVIATKAVLLALTSTLLLAGLCACDDSGGTPGQKLDRALDKTGDALKDAGEAIQTK